MKRSYRAIVTTCYWGVLTYLLVQGKGGHPGTAGWRAILHNLAHIPAFGILAYLLAWTRASVDKSGLVGIFIIVFLYGAGMEGVQALIPDRLASVSDVVLNSIGAGTALFLVKREYLKIIL